MIYQTFHSGEIQLVFLFWMGVPQHWICTGHGFCKPGESWKRQQHHHRHEALVKTPFGENRKSLKHPGLDKFGKKTFHKKCQGLGKPLKTLEKCLEKLWKPLSPRLPPFVYFWNLWPRMATSQASSRPHRVKQDWLRRPPLAQRLGMSLWGINIEIF